MTRSSNKPASAAARRLAVVALALGLLPLAGGEIRGQGLLSNGSVVGRVLDASGNPLAGALVAVVPASGNGEETRAVTDRTGAFRVESLAAGQYLVRITKTRFLPLSTDGFRVDPGADLVLTVNLQTALDVIRRGVRRGGFEDVKWDLRAAPSSRPILRYISTSGPEAEDAAVAAQAARDPLAFVESGYLQLYSTSVETPVGLTDAVSSEFAVSVPMAADSEVTLTGQYTEDATRPRGFGAAYEFRSTPRKQSTVAVGLRTGALLDGEAGLGTSEIRMDYDEQLQWSDHLVFTYGAAVGRTVGDEAADNYWRPAAGVSWVPGNRTTLTAAYSARAPMDSGDPVRGQDYFRRAVYIPAEFETYSHVEIGAAHAFADSTRISLAGFRDEMGTQAFLVDSEDGRRGVMFLDGTGRPTTGVRFFVDKEFKDFEAGVGYTFASAAGFDPGVTSPDNLYRDLSQRNLHVVTARFSSEIELTETTITAVYRWVSGFSLAPVDPYQRFSEYNDPTLSITVMQELPAPRLIPARFRAIVDARNLFEPSFGSRRTVFAGHPRLLKGGIHIQF